ncbi:DNA-binding response regulator, OmpR family, contains REC and winged-helix (wHTH) domain [Fontibacillus panacisegetis]|uniref:DNA-binding response regulator, OmpR family, contains REC and winged-helix (WHTH) domain n=1 Tax=Fontibacillus panacisegetis TaxID=670482 RepID=A0A1G7MDD2_9BACL|nr:response regulator transcription factor [Fontibacillus panacisegetis]SDF59838.1 DNA-binding response regulator, OmpR family, contains REC and winged-helix (wHTH) domain [Fontibacillus panacisegetis]
MITILIVEDDISLNKGIALTLAQDGIIIEQAYDLTSAETLFFSRSIDLIVLDVNLPDGSGLDFCQKIRAASRIPIIFLTANDMESDIVLGFELGGDDYITKPFSLMVLRSRVMAVLRRSDLGREDKLILGDMTFDFGKMDFRRQGQQIALSKTEQKLLKVLVSNRGQILTRDQLMDQVWIHGAEFVDENALTVTVKRLRAKIEDDPSAPKYIKTVYGLGYVWTEGMLDEKEH